MSSPHARAGAVAIALALGGRRIGSRWMACCPAHDDGTPSLSIGESPDGKVLLKCHAGCSQRDVVEALRSRNLWSPRCRAASRPTGQRESRPAGPGNHREVARALWRRSLPAASSIVEKYLASRGISVPPPPSLRFNPSLKHPTGSRWPAMVAVVTDGVDGTFRGVHRTYLATNGTAKASVQAPRLMLGRCRGGAVRLGPANDHLLVGEGIETCLAAAQATGMTAWAALSTSGLRALDLPETVGKVTILADGDDAGEAAALAAARRWRTSGRHVRIARPGIGLDFNDLLLGVAPQQECSS